MLPPEVLSVSLSTLSLRRRPRAVLAALARASAPILACVGVRPSGALEASSGLCRSSSESSVRPASPPASLSAAAAALPSLRSSRFLRHRASLSRMRWATPRRVGRRACGKRRVRRGGTSSGRRLHTRVQSEIHSLANLAAARATCRLAAAARRSQARRGAQPTQDAGLHPRPRLCPAHGRLAARVRGRWVVVEDLGVPGSADAPDWKSFAVTRGDVRTHAARDAQPAGAAARGGSLCVRRSREDGTPATRHKRQGERRSELSARTTTPTCGDGLHAVKNRAAGGEGGPRARQREPSDHPPW